MMRLALACAIGALASACGALEAVPDKVCVESAITGSAQMGKFGGVQPVTHCTRWELRCPAPSVPVQTNEFGILCRIPAKP